ncbi:PDZ domain-containing protein [Candidatus Palauibacter sp.]|uniref:PDZ domain-containing protein n=1 Tax=Candidatus Palauibacter sp. TaxID=3101350 RepID=UPI003B526A37
MNQESGKSLAVALGVALLAGFGFGAGPVTAQEEGEDDRRERVSILSSGSGGYLGVEIRDVDEERASDLGMPRPYGAFISDVVAEGPADEAGLNNGDVIVRWNGERLESVAQLQRLAGETPPGREVQLTVLRDGAERELSVELGSRRSWLSQAAQGGLVVNPPTSWRGLTWLSPPSVQIQPGRGGANIRFFGRPRLGANVQTLGDQLADYFGVEGGALVTSVSADSPAAAAGLLAGDVIVGIDDEDVSDPGDLTRVLADIEAGEVSVRIVRDGTERTLTVELEEVDRIFRWRRGDDDGETGLPSFGPGFGPASFRRVLLSV